jgi:hypothetical protein
MILNFVSNVYLYYKVYEKVSGATIIYVFGV